MAPGRCGIFNALYALLVQAAREPTTYALVLRRRDSRVFKVVSTAARPRTETGCVVPGKVFNRVAVTPNLRPPIRSEISGGLVCPSRALLASSRQARRLPRGCLNAMRKRRA